MSTDHPLDLHEIATLANYERAATEPRFRHAKLRECSVRPDGKLILSTSPHAQSLLKRAGVPVRGFAFDTVLGKDDDFDLPTNMLPDPPMHPSVSQLNEDELEIIYWEVRGHDGCYKAIGILQHFFDLFPDSQPLRIRTAEGEDFTTRICDRIIYEFELREPLQITFCSTPTKIYTTGDQPTMKHAVWGFARPGESMVGITLDLASMQFGSKGRGKGGETFRLGTIDGFYDFLETILGGGADVLRDGGGSARIREGADDAWMKDVARRVKERWDKRETEPWCGHCGTPLKEPKNCPCKGAYYCGAAHQKVAWKYHKHHCTASRK